MDRPLSAAPEATSLGWTRAAETGLTFRRIGNADLAFLSRVYASTRAEELAALDWADEHKAAFLEQQFQAQHAHYQQHYPDADWLVTMRDGEDIGRLYLERWPSQHRIIDIALLPAHRGHGLGAAARSGCGSKARSSTRPRRPLPAKRCRSTSRSSTRRCGSIAASVSKPKRTRASMT